MGQMASSQQSPGTLGFWKRSREIHQRSHLVQAGSQRLHKYTPGIENEKILRISFVKVLKKI